MMVEISKENEEKISHMSHEEIIEQQKKLAAMFGMYSIVYLCVE